MPFANSSKQVFQFRLVLEGIKPLVWRRILVPADFTLAQLHRVIQAVMDWEDCHLHQFTIAGRVYGIPDPDGEHEFIDDRTVRLRNLQLSPRQRIEYVYDFGDDWLHVLILEEVSQSDAEDIRPLCIGGEHAAPPEDIGGALGYEEFREALSDPNHERHDELKEWIGYAFDPEDFLVEEANNRLRTRFRRRHTARRT